MVSRLIGGIAHMSGGVSQMMHKVKMSGEEINLLLKPWLNEGLRQSLTQVIDKTGPRPKGDEQRELVLPEELADDIRNECGDRLQTHGLTEDYSYNAEGNLLAVIMDKLFIG